MAPCPADNMGDKIYGGGPNVVVPPAADCSDRLGGRKCSRKKLKGKCFKKKVRSKKCQFTCGSCEASRRHAPI